MKPKLIINTITSWEEPPRARHQFTYALAKKFPVIFITRNKTGWMKLVITHPQHNITLIEPYFPIDYRLRYRLPFINELYQIWLYTKLKRISNIGVVNFDFTGSLISKYFKNIIYYCTDEYTSTSRYNSKLINLYIARCEKLVARRSKFCIATSIYLVNKLSKYNPLTYEIPLGVDSTYFKQKKININKKSTDKIIVGLLGFISERQTSIEIINEIVSHNKLQLVIIGPIEDSFLKKIEYPELIKMTGTLKGLDLAAELSKIDVGIALYNLNKINLGTTPNKLWQYISMGKPGVISNLPNLKHTAFPEKTVYKLLRDIDAIDLIIRANSEDSSILRHSRIEFAKQNTWEIRVAKFMEIFNLHFPSHFNK